MVEVAASWRLQDGLQWLCDFALQGQLPSLGPVGPDVHLTDKQKGWGTVEVIGVGTHTYLLPVIREQMIEEGYDYWRLPQDQIDDLLRGDDV